MPECSESKVDQEVNSLGDDYCARQEVKQVTDMCWTELIVTDLQHCAIVLLQ